MSIYSRFGFFEKEGPVPVNLSPDISSVFKFFKFPKIESKLLISPSYEFGKKACSTLGHP